MARLTPSSRPCGHVLHTRPDLYVVVTYEPKDGAPNCCKALCERLDDGEPGAALVAYLSPFDALVDASFSSRPGKTYHVLHAAEFDPRDMVQDSGGKLFVDLHCGWAASDGRIVVRRRGSLASLCLSQELSVPVEQMHAIDLAIDQDALDTVERLREHAGLFAYRDTYALPRAWTERERHQAVAAAIQRMPGRASVDAEINQAALYDPEAQQWHFVPIEVFFADTDGDGNT